MSVARTDPSPDPRPAQQGVVEPRPYPPSFVDRITEFVQRQPIPYGLTYLLLFILQSAVFLVFSWKDGWLPAFEFQPIVLLFPFWLWGPLAIVTYLDSLSHRVLSDFAPLLNLPAEGKRRLEYEFATMARGSVLLSAVAWSGIYFLFWYLAIRHSTMVYRLGPLATWLAVVQGFVSFSVGSAIYYHSVRQLRLVSRTVGMVGQFDLFRLDPVYAFSLLTSRTGICWVVLVTMTLLIAPLEVGTVPGVSMLILQIALAMGAFVLPLRIVNRRLVSEKRRQLAELDQRVKATLARLHQHVDENSLEEVSKLNDVLKGLTTEREILTRIPTWPWRPGLFAGFVSIIVLPIVLFFIQFGLGRWLGV